MPVCARITLPSLFLFCRISLSPRVCVCLAELKVPSTGVHVRRVRAMRDRERGRRTWAGATTDTHTHMHQAHGEESVNQLKTTDNGTNGYYIVTAW